MASPPVLIDTSIFIEHLRKQDKTKSILYKVVDSYVLHTSTVVEFELYAGATSEQKQQDVGLVLMHSTIMPLTSDVAQQAARLYRQLSVNSWLRTQLLGDHRGRHLGDDGLCDLPTSQRTTVGSPVGRSAVAALQVGRSWSGDQVWLRRCRG